MASQPQTSRTQKLRLNRRAFLGLAWLGIGAMLAVKFIDVAVQFAKPRRKTGEFGGIFDLGPVEDLPEPGEAPVYYPKGRFWLVRLPQGLLALHNVCTHLDCLMGWDTSAEEFACPCHGSMFAIDGTYLTGPAPRSLDRFVIQLVSSKGEIAAETDLSTGTPLYTGETEENDGEGESDASDSSGDQPNYAKLTVLVDTGRKISGAPAA